MKTNVLRFISTVLVLSICLTILPSFPAFAQEPFVQTVTPIDPEYISLQQLQTMVLPEEDRPEAVESYLVEQKGHVLRLREQEEDLNTVVFQNRDGNKTMYYFDQPVKYVDENGNIKDKKTTVTSVIDKAEYSADYGFVTSDNDIKTYFPKKLVGNKGILVEYQDVKIEVIPLSAEKNILSSAQKKQDLVDSQTRDSVEYNKAFGNNTLLKYTPTFGGFKEDIILASYAGKNEFSFKIKTNGLALVCEDGKYYLADPATEEKLMQVGDIVVYDSSMVPNTTPSVPVLNPVKPEPKELTEEEKNALYFPEGPLDPVYEHYYQLETVKEAEEYMLTIVVDEDYLTCEDTVYPVTIDPSLTVVGSSFLDTTIYTNYSSAQGSSLNMFVGNHATRYGGTRGVARALIRFPGLFSNSTFASLSADDISHVDFMIRDTMCEGDGVWIDCYRLTQSWSESTAVYSSALWNGYVGFIDDEYVQYNGGTGSDGTGTGHWYHFNITNVVKEWLDGYYGGVSNHYGIMLKAFEETDPAKTFGTSENADYPPKVVVDYTGNAGGGDNGGGSTAVTSVQFSQDEYVVPVGWSGTFDVIVNPEGAVSGGFNWVLIGAQDIATINYTTGVFTALAEGTKTLFVGAKNGGTGDSCTIRIVSASDVPVSSLEFEQESYGLALGWAGYINPIIYPSSATVRELRWTSSNTQVANVDHNTGLITTTGVGSAYITARSIYGNGSASIFVSVNRNQYFNQQYTDQLKADVSDLLGSSKKSLVHHYTPSECIDIILGYDTQITDYCNLYSVPKEYVQTLLLRELWCVNETDDLADDLVVQYFNWKQRCEDWYNYTPAQQVLIPFPGAPLVIREDSSTGIGQMFAWVAINANNLAIQLGLIQGTAYNSENWQECKEVWYLLKNNPLYSIKMTTLEMYHCAQSVGLTTDFFNYSSSQIKSLLARYNGTNEGATQYGEECYEYYLIFKEYNE